MNGGWETKRVDEIAQHSLGKMLDKAKNRGQPQQYLRNLNVRWFDFDLSSVLEMRFEPTEMEKYSIRKGDLVICEGGYPGRAAIWQRDDPICFQKALHRVRFHEPEHAVWCLYYLHYCDLVGSLKDHFNGAGIQHFTGEALAAFTLPVPPLHEQRRIVEILDEVFEGIATAKANAERNLQSAREVFEGHLAAVFSARNEGWTDRPLHTLCRRITVGHVGSMANQYKPSGIPFLRSQNIRPFSVSMENLVYIDEDFHAALEKSSLQAGDVAIVRTGYPGTAAVIPETLGVANCSDLVIVRPGPEVDAHFLTAFFNSAFGKVMVSGKVVGAAQKHFNVGAAKHVVLHLPPINEQHSIVAAAAELRAETQRLEVIYTASLAA